MKLAKPGAAVGVGELDGDVAVVLGCEVDVLGCVADVLGCVADGVLVAGAAVGATFGNEASAKGEDQD